MNLSYLYFNKTLFHLNMKPNCVLYYYKCVHLFKIFNILSVKIRLVASKLTEYKISGLIFYKFHVATNTINTTEKTQKKTFRTQNYFCFLMIAAICFLHAMSCRVSFHHRQNADFYIIRASANKFWGLALSNTMLVADIIFTTSTI